GRVYSGSSRSPSGGLRRSSMVFVLSLGTVGKTLVTRGPKKDEDGNVVKGPDDVPYEEDYANFHFQWNKGHYEILPNEFTYERGELSAKEVEDYDRLVAFVESFPANLL
ncbi:hypothetical protein A2U01_0066649, partial [Trifolium medium]|nr:hypothetical protein [Trifolium medium]